MLHLLTRLLIKSSFDLYFNLFLILIFLFSKNYLEEDFIIGFLSLIILFISYFSIKELKREDLRQFRLKVKKIFRIQKKLLKTYMFFGTILLKKFIKYTKKIFFKIFRIKLKKIFFNLLLKINNLILKIIYIKIFNFNILFDLTLLTLQNINIF